MADKRKLWLVRNGKVVAIVPGSTREGAKVNARSFLAGDPDTYTVSPLTNEDDTVLVMVRL